MLNFVITYFLKQNGYEKLTFNICKKMKKVSIFVTYMKKWNCKNCFDLLHEKGRLLLREVNFCE